jgi:uncharacterized protein (DUF2267 family)
MKDGISRDRTERELVLDQDVKSVLEFMQDNIPAEKLIAVAESMPKLARLLWEYLPQEPMPILVLRLPKVISDQESQLLASAT